MGSLFTVYVDGDRVDNRHGVYSANSGALQAPAVVGAAVRIELVASRGTLLKTV
jgi:hypothetical protein